jgi:squalene synthase HpnC
MEVSPVVWARWNTCRDWSTAVARRYLTASRRNETNLSQRTTVDDPVNRAGGENFSVAARLLPAEIRRHLLAVYTYARLVDDIGDEASGNRIALLDTVSDDLDRIYAGQPPRRETLHDLCHTIQACGMPREPFDALIAANRQDQVVSRYNTYGDLLRYCELSANPVGHLVLYVFGQYTRPRRELSDRICTALQILEHCQDVVEDLDNGRIYLPVEDMDRFGVTEAELKSAPAGPAVRGLIAFETQRALRLLDDGTPLVGSLHGAARLAISGYLAGGLATAKAIGDAGYDVLGGPPKPSKVTTIREWSRLLTVGGAR